MIKAIFSAILVLLASWLTCHYDSEAGILTFLATVCYYGVAMGLMTGISIVLRSNVAYAFSVVLLMSLVSRDLDTIKNYNYDYHHATR